MSTADFFRSRLDGMIDVRHPLAVLASRLPWRRIEQELAPLFEHQDRPVNIRWLLRAIVRLGLMRVFCACRQWPWLRG